MIVASLAVNNVVPGRPGELLRGYWLSRSGPHPCGARFRHCRSRPLSGRPRPLRVANAHPSARCPRLVGEHGLRRCARPGGRRRTCSRCGVVVRDRSPRGLARGLAPELPRSALRRFLSGVVRGTAQSLKTVDLVLVFALSVLAWVIWGAGAWLAAESLGIGSIRGRDRLRDCTHQPGRRHPLLPGLRRHLPVADGLDACALRDRPDGCFRVLGLAARDLVRPDDGARVRDRNLCRSPASSTQL